MSLFRPYKLTKTQINNLPLSEGQCIFSTDTNELFLDINNSSRIPVVKNMVKTFSIAAAAWTQIDNLYTATITDADVTTTSLTDVAIDGTTYAIAEAAKIKPYTDEINGGIKLYAESAPTGIISGKYTISRG